MRLDFWKKAGAVVRRFLQNQSGASVLEYALIVGLIIAGVVFALAAMSS
jgi:Flp pilus assembly pilin Flp